MYRESGELFVTIWIFILSIYSKVGSSIIYKKFGPIYGGFKNCWIFNWRPQISTSEPYGGKIQKLSIDSVKQIKKYALNT
jgi:hypothetical protein